MKELSKSANFGYGDAKAYDKLVEELGGPSVVLFFSDDELLNDPTKLSAFMYLTDGLAFDPNFFKKAVKVISNPLLVKVFLKKIT